MTDSKRTRDTLDGILSELRRRQRALHVAQSTLIGLFYGAVAAVFVAAFGVLFRTDWAVSGLWQALWCVPVGASLGAVVGLIRRVDALRLARAMDEAADSEDRFASALQLHSHHRQARARLIEADALAAVEGVRPQSALRFQAPKQVKFLPLPAVLLALLLWLAPSARIDAGTVEEPEISPDQWAELNREFKEELENLPEPKTDEEKDLQAKLKKLAEMLEKNPEKKDVLEQIARLKTELEKRQKQLPGRNLSMRNAAKNMKASKALKPFTSQLKKGDYKKAANAFKALADKIRKNADAMSAEDFEAAAADLEQMSSELSSHDELGHACKNCAKAAESMNRDKLADALDQFSKKLEKNSDQLRECDSMCKADSLIDQLMRKMNNCKSSKNCSACKNGNGECNSSDCNGSNKFVKRNNKKGGLKAGWGTADQWNGGQMTRNKEKRTPDLAQVNQQAGRSTKLTTISKEEHAESSLSYREMFAEYVQKAEADLALESAPIAYREFLKRYFTAIRPDEGSSTAGESPKRAD